MYMKAAFGGAYNWHTDNVFHFLVAGEAPAPRAQKTARRALRPLALLCTTHRLWAAASFAGRSSPCLWAQLQRQDRDAEKPADACVILRELLYQLLVVLLGAAAAGP